MVAAKKPSLSSASSFYIKYGVCADHDGVTFWKNSFEDSKQEIPTDKFLQSLEAFGQRTGQELVLPLFSEALIFFFAYDDGDDDIDHHEYLKFLLNRHSRCLREACANLIDDYQQRHTKFTVQMKESTSDRLEMTLFLRNGGVPFDHDGIHFWTDTFGEHTQEVQMINFIDDLKFFGQINNKPFPMPEIKKALIYFYASKEDDLSMDFQEYLRFLLNKQSSSLEEALKYLVNDFQSLTRDPGVTAAKNGDTETLVNLIQQGHVIVDNALSSTPLLCVAAHHGHVSTVQALLQHSANPNIKDKHLQTPLILACLNGHLPVVRALKDICDLNLKDANKNTALMACARRGHLDCLRELLRGNEASVDVNAVTDQGGISALMWASKDNHFLCVRELLLLDNININLQDNDGWTALLFAASSGHIECVTELLNCEKHKVDVNCATKSLGMSSLMYAAMGGHHSCVKALNVNDILVNETDLNGTSALHHAFNGKHKECSTLLLTFPGITGAKYEPPSFDLVKRNDSCTSFKSLSSIDSHDDVLGGKEDIALFKIQGEFTKRSARTFYKRYSWKVGTFMLRNTTILVYAGKQTEVPLFKVELPRYELEHQPGSLVYDLKFDGTRIYLKTTNATDSHLLQKTITPLVKAKPTKGKKDKEDTHNPIKRLKNAKKEKSPTASFGISYKEYFGARPKVFIPVVVSKLISEIERRGVAIDGIYRQCGFSSLRKELMETFNEEENSVNLCDTEKWHDFMTLGSTLKQYFRDLPHSAFLKYSPYFLKIVDQYKKTADLDSTIKKMRFLVYCMPTPMFHTLGLLFLHLHMVSEADNKMDCTNLATCWGPTLFNDCDYQQMSDSNKATELIILNFKTIFTVTDEFPPDETKQMEQDLGLDGFYPSDSLDWRPFTTSNRNEFHKTGRTSTRFSNEMSELDEDIKKFALACNITY